MKKAMARQLHTISVVSIPLRVPLKNPSGQGVCSQEDGPGASSAWFATNLPPNKSAFSMAYHCNDVKGDGLINGFN